MVLYEQIIQHIIQQIQAGTILPGDRLPSEKELAEQFDVSRITSKKAMDYLAQHGIITRARGKGSFVSNELPDLESLLDHRDGQHVVRANQHTLIGLIMPDFAETYGLQMVHSIEKACSDVNAHIIVKRTYGQREREEEAIDQLLSLGVKGIIIFPVHGEHYNARLLQPVYEGFPVVLVDRYLKGIPACAVYTDNIVATEQLTDHLFDLGHEHIAFLSPPPLNTSTLEDRLQGFHKSLNKRGQTLEGKYVLTDLYSTLPDAFRSENIKQDEAIIDRFIDQNPELTAFVVNEYNLAKILTRVLDKKGKSVPQHCSVGCFDSPANPFEQPFFTHIEQGESQMGKEAVRLVMEQIDGHTVDKHHVIPHRLIKGCSTEKARAPHSSPLFISQKKD